MIDHFRDGTQMVTRSISMQMMASMDDRRDVTTERTMSRAMSHG